MIVGYSEGLPRALARLGITRGSAAAKAVWRTANAMARGPLPSKQDMVVAGGQLIVRKVSGWQVWVWTQRTGSTLIVITLTAEAPVTQALSPVADKKRRRVSNG